MFEFKGTLICRNRNLCIIRMTVYGGHKVEARFGGELSPFISDPAFGIVRAEGPAEKPVRDAWKLQDDLERESRRLG